MSNSQQSRSVFEKLYNSEIIIPIISKFPAFTFTYLFGIKEGWRIILPSYIWPTTNQFGSQNSGRGVLPRVDPPTSI